MEEKTKVLKIIQKLLALGGNNPNENEAISALAKAKELLVTHNLSMSEVESGIEENGAVVIMDHVDFKSKLFWKSRLGIVLAHHNFCSLVRSSRKGTGKLIFIGRRDNVEVCKAIYPWMLLQIEHLVNSAVAEIDSFGEGYVEGKLGFKESFCEGVLDRLHVRLASITSRLNAENNKCGALMVCVEKENTDFIKNNFGNSLKEAHFSHVVDRSARQFGFSEGGKLAIDKQLAKSAN